MKNAARALILLLALALVVPIAESGMRIARFSLLSKTVTGSGGGRFRVIQSSSVDLPGSHRDFVVEYLSQGGSEFQLEDQARELAKVFSAAAFEAHAQTLMIKAEIPVRGHLLTYYQPKETDFFQRDGEWVLPMDGFTP